MKVSCRPFTGCLGVPVAIPPLYVLAHHIHHHPGQPFAIPAGSQWIVFVERGPDDPELNPLAWVFQHAEEIARATFAEMLMPASLN